MLDQPNIHQQVVDAIDASEKIIASLKSGDFEAAGRFDNDRAKLIRTLSKQQNLETTVAPYVTELKTLSELDNVIQSISEKLRDEVLTEINKEQANRLRHVQYAENQRL